LALVDFGSRGCFSFLQCLFGLQSIEVKRFSTYLKLWLPPFLWMTVLFYLSSISNLRAVPDPGRDELIRSGAHFFFYALGYLLFFRAFSGKRKNFLLPLLVVLIYAFLDELHQHFVPIRTFQIQDLLVDGAGAFLGLLLLQEKRLVGLVTRR